MSTYKLGVVPIPTNKPMIRAGPVRPRLQERDRQVRAGRRGHRDAARERASRSWSVPTSVEKSEYLSRLLRQEGHQARGPEREEPRPRGGDRRPGRPPRRGHRRHQHGRPRHRHHARRQRRVPRRRGDERPRPGSGGDARGVRGGLGRVLRGDEGEGRGSRPRRSSRPAACTCSAPSATSRAASTTSCAAAPAVRATRARAGSTCRLTDDLMRLFNAGAAEALMGAHELPRRHADRVEGRSPGRSAARRARSRRATPRSARTSSSTTTC